MKYLSLFLLIGVLFGFNSAIKNDLGKKKNKVEKKIDYGNLNKNLLIASKEDLQGFWVYDFKDYEEGKYYGKFIFLFEKIEQSKIEGKLFHQGLELPIIFNLNEGKNTFTLSCEKNLETIPYKSWNLEINKGTGQLQGKLTVKDYNGDSETYSISIPKMNFNYNPDNTIMSYYVDYDKTGMGYRKYSSMKLKREPLLVEEEVLVETTEGKEKKVKLPAVKKKRREGEYRQGYYATTNAVYGVNPSKEVLKKDLVESLTKADLYILRNSIFAKHGMIFKNEKLRAFFMQESWYMPISTDVTASLTKIERSNVDILKRYEQNAKEYFQVFGR